MLCNHHNRICRTASIEDYPPSSVIFNSGDIPHTSSQHLPRLKSSSRVTCDYRGCKLQDVHTRHWQRACFPVFAIIMCGGVRNRFRSSACAWHPASSQLLLWRRMHCRPESPQHHHSRQGPSSSLFAVSMHPLRVLTCLQMQAAAAPWSSLAHSK